jgi:putative acetyltransferase
MGQAFPKPGLRPYLATDIPLLEDIVHSSIEELTADDYSEDQQAAWQAAIGDTDALAKRLGKQLTLIATIGSGPVGFASLRGNDHIDMLFVHPTAARQGVATALIDALEKLSGGRGAAKLTVDASDTARPFFERRGYTATLRNTIALGAEWLGNTSMQKTLAPPPTRESQ